jgi:glycosyltransferase involved in cell wall biosynthesis
MIYNGPSRSGTPHQVNRDPFRVIYVGQLIPEKGVDLLLDAAALLVNRFPQISVDIVGMDDGWVSERYLGYRERLKARAAQPDLRGRVRFLGWRDDVRELLASAAVHCHPARPEQREGFGNVVLEAKLAGTPSVVSGVGALPELIRHREDGWVCDTLTPSAFAEGIAWFLASADVRLAAGVRAHASADRFGRDEFAARWWEVFADADTARLRRHAADEHSTPVQTR